MRHALLGLALLIAVLPAGHSGAEEPAPASRAPAATIFGQPIYLEEFQPPPHLLAAPGETDEERGRQILEWRFDEAQRKIWQALSDQFCATHDCEPTGEDYAAFEAGVKRAAAGRPEPAEPIIPEEEYQRLRAELTVRIEASQDAQEKAAAQDALGQLERVRQWSPGDVSQDVARAMIRAWKLNKALFAEYGGTVIWQQVGLEPVGAYEAWLKEHQAKGSFTLSDPALTERFWRYFAMEHQVVDDEFLASAGLTHPFEKPWWAVEPPP